MNSRTLCPAGIGLKRKQRLEAVAHTVLQVEHVLEVATVRSQAALAEPGAAVQLCDSATIVDIDPCSLFQIGAESDELCCSTACRV